MLKSHLLALLPAAIACSLPLQVAQADVYAWVNGSGGVTYSDVPPPAGARVLEVVPESAPRTVMPREPAQESDARILAERVRLLERQMDLAANQPAPAVQYQVPPATQYPTTSVPQTTFGCQGVWADCWWWWTQPPTAFSPVYGAVVAPFTGFRHFHRFHGARFVRGSGAHH
jgi:hypothetical protein